jgi:hypothetical protein
MKLFRALFFPMGVASHILCSIALSGDRGVCVEPQNAAGMARALLFVAS